MLRRLLRRWAGPGGVQEVLRTAYPLILGQISFTVQTSVDRVFLTWYSPEAVAGAVTGLFATWTLIALFIGTGEYLTTFVAQYFGARQYPRIGAALWQGIYFAMLAALVLASLVPLAEPAFALAGHQEAVRVHETAYARTLLLGAFPVVLLATLSTFFAGRGETLVVLLVNVLATAVNVVLDYLWIFGHAGFPRAGVTGAAWATVTSQGVGALVFFVLMTRPRHRRAFATLAAWRPEPALLGRLLRFGLPSGLHYSLEVLAFAAFMVLVGRQGNVPLAASGIAFSLNMIVFMPMLGLGVAVSALVGRYLGGGRPHRARRATWSAFWVSLAYMAACGALYVLAPRLLLAPFAAGADPAAFAPVSDMAVVLLRFVALYSIFDMMNVVFAAGLKGAGDTVYPLAASVTISWLAMLIPTWVACELLGFGVYVAWTAASAYVILIGLLLLRRFQAGRWTTMRVIEAHGVTGPERPLGSADPVAPALGDP